MSGKPPVSRRGAKVPYSLFLAAGTRGGEGMWERREGARDSSRSSVALWDEC